MAWCLTAPSHYMSQCWLLISAVLWHSLQSNFSLPSYYLLKWILKSSFQRCCLILQEPLNRPIAQISQCTSPMSHNAPFCSRNVRMCARFCYRMVHCGIFVWCIVGFVRWVYCMCPTFTWRTIPQEAGPLIVSTRQLPLQVCIVAYDVSSGQRINHVTILR